MNFKQQFNLRARRFLKRCLPREFRERRDAELIELKHLRRYQLLAEHFLHQCRDERGLLSEGRSNWSSRWQSGNFPRILLLAPKDYSGSFFKWAEALNRHSEYAARLITLEAHQYGYQLDLVSTGRYDNNWVPLSTMLEEADILHIKDEIGFLDGSNGIPVSLMEKTKKRIPVVYTAYGGIARKLQVENEFRNHLQSFAARVAMTPDLIFDKFNGTYIPHSIDEDKYIYSWVDGNIVAHSPSTALRKGTDIFLSALRDVQADIKIELDLISGVAHNECVERKSRASMFFDQAGRERLASLGTDKIIGWYGNSALEAAVFGIPTIAHLSEQAFDGAERGGRSIKETCSIISTEPSSNSMRKTIKGYFNESAEYRRDLSLKTRKWVEDFHGYRATSKMLSSLYDQLI